MKAVDTNVVVRAMMRDDPVQTPIAAAGLTEGAYVSLTVLLETGWLLRSRYSLDRVAVADVLRALVDIPAVEVERCEEVQWAIDRLAQKGDWADILHLVAGCGTEAFMTFDRDILRALGSDSLIPIETLA